MLYCYLFILKQYNIKFTNNHYDIKFKFLGNFKQMDRGMVRMEDHDTMDEMSNRNITHVHAFRGISSDSGSSKF